ncbi:MAG: hypothetical protein WBA74_21315 [Cyclobacteriaceae bacterium]
MEDYEFSPETFKDTVEKLKIATKLVNDRQTGTPAEFGAKVEFSDEDVAVFLDYANREGVPILYDESIPSYYFDTDNVVKYIFEFSVVKI